MSKFERDDTLIAAAESNAGAPIETSGAYVGVFSQAKQRVAKTGTKGIEFTFESTEGAVARYLTLWVERANGERIDYSYGLLSGLMACLELKQIESAAVVSEEWSNSVGARVPTEIETYPELINRQVGVLLQREEQEWEGRTRVSMRIVDFFNPASRQMPAEILTGTVDSGQLDRLTGGLKDKILRAAPPSMAASSNASNNSGSSYDSQVSVGPKYDEFGAEDIPF